MKIGLLNIPHVSDLQLAYHHLLHHHPTSPHLSSLALFSQWCRFDPRLAEIWVHYLASHWQTMNPIELNNALRQQPWPAAAGVLLEFVQLSFHKDSSEDAKKYQLWKKLVTFDFLPADWEFYFIGIHKIGGKFMLEDSCFSLIQYKSWGYLGRDILIHKPELSPFTKAHFQKEVRYQILKSLFKSNPRVHVKMYWEAVNKSISLRQAERDLSECGFVEAVGQTKGRYYKWSSSFS